MANVGEFIAQQLESAGIDITGEEFKPLLGLTVAMPEGVSDKVKAALMPVDMAKNNKDIKSHIIGQYLKGIDSNLKEKMETLGLSKDAIDEVYSSEEGKNFSGRITLMLEKLDSLHKEAAKATGKKTPEEIEAFKKQIEALNAEVLKARKEKEDETNSLKNAFETERLNNEIAIEFKGKKWSENIPENLRLDIANVALQKRLEADGAKIIRDQSGKPKIVPSDNLEADYFDKSNKKVSFTEYVDGLMSENKFIAVTPSASSQSANNTNSTGTSKQAQPAFNNNATSRALGDSMREAGLV